MTKEITVVLIGTVHETPEEKHVFDTLNQFIGKRRTASSSKIPMHWMCEGEADYRHCISLKDYKVHLLTDSLFIVMMLNDFVSDDSTFLTDFYNRIIELFITIVRCDLQLDNLIPSHYKPLLHTLQNQTPIKQETMDQIVTKLKHIPIQQFRTEIQTLTRNLVNLVLSQNIIPSKYYDCVRDFMIDPHTNTWTGNSNLTNCEDILMMQLRDESFVELIMQYINSLNQQKHWVLVTIGSLHCQSLQHLLESRGVKVRIINTDNLLKH